MRRSASCCGTHLLRAARRQNRSARDTECFSAAAGDQLVSHDVTTAGSWEANVKCLLIHIPEGFFSRLRLVWPISCCHELVKVSSYLAPPAIYIACPSQEPELQERWWTLI